MNKYADQSRAKESYACTRKRRYNTEGEAEIGMRQSGRRNVYRCEFCGGWHVTSHIPKASWGDRTGEAKVGA